MNSVSIYNSPLGKIFVNGLASMMESPLRYKFWKPEKILAGAGLQSGQTVLEVGCGTGYFTLPAARLIGPQGNLLAMDILPEAVDFVSKKVQAAQLGYVPVLQRDALNTNFDSGRFDTVLLFGVLPSPWLPLPSLLSELQRVLKAGGLLAVWPSIPGLSRSILRSGLFSWAGKRAGVLNFIRLESSKG